MESPLFLFGYDRSGTTLLSMVTGAHRDIAVPFSTTGLWYRYGDRLEDFNKLATPADRDRLVAALLAEERIELWNADLAVEDIRFDRDSAVYADIVAAFHAAFARKQGKSRWGNIDIATLDELPRVNAWFPNARFVHIVRDGRDIALSHQTMPYGAGNIAECADKWSLAVTANLAQGELLGPERYLVVRYEDLITDLQTTARRLCDFAGLDFDDGMLAYAGHAAATVPEDRMWLWQNLTRPPDASRVYNWRHNMGRARRVVFESHAGAALALLGYESWDSIPKSLGAELLEYYYVLTRGHRLRRLLGRLGIRRRSTLEKNWKRRQAGKERPSVAASAPGATENGNR